MSGVGDAGTVAEVYRDLLSRAPENRMQPRLEPMRRVLALLGDPQQAAPVIHLTGTNGKTSTARMIEAVLRSYGLRTGRYTSPHLRSVTERISLDGEPVADETFVRVWNEILPIVQTVDAELEADGQPRLTYFEAVTTLAFAVFADAPVEVVVLEVGLGGTTDATNVADGAVAVVTPISLDHTELLGQTEAEIAEEKAGIIKPGGFLVSAAQDRDAAQVLLEAARAVQVPFRFEGVEFGVVERSLAVGGQQVSVRGLASEYRDLFLPLHGEHQAENLAVAIAALEAFLGGGERPLEEDLLREGLAQVSSPGRLEVLRTAPTVIVDAAHNPAGVRATARAVQEAFGFTRLALVVGVLAEKDARGMLEALYRAFGDDVEDIALTQSASPRAVPAGDLAALAVDAGWGEDDVFVTESVPDALEWAVGRAEAVETSADALASGTGGGVLVLGSITLAAEVRALLGEPSHAGPVTVAARGLDPADLLAATGLEDGEGALDPEVIALLDEADDAPGIDAGQLSDAAQVSDDDGAHR
ncbi:bifunctional folylpolyglutamate synthase/dihydrofolate synthase [Micrococcus sp.]|uniref:bifunctional folylpolyglutamate synthase/dihydrofolate synthase n=1 Tax=Micrococcus sp. TaxID=1271 RepID=UPI002A91D57C|nr:Mur ligase family protein [Micrococcus sp.]MDY6055132.1 Mur ligase family protein [Micrococcus sp.]